MSDVARRIAIVLALVVAAVGLAAAAGRAVSSEPRGPIPAIDLDRPPGQVPEAEPPPTTSSLPGAVLPPIGEAPPGGEEPPSAPTTAPPPPSSSPSSTPVGPDDDGSVDSMDDGVGDEDGDGDD